jgi:hypothetical protein
MVMDSEFVNRLGMFNTALDTLNGAEFKPTWYEKQPKIFTLKVAQAATAVEELEAFCRQRSSDITGVTAEKAREEKEAAAATHTLARLLVQWFRDHNDETNAAKVDVPLRGFTNLRDAEAVAKMRETVSLAQAIVSGADSEAAADYGLTSDAVTAVNQEVEEFASIVTAPQASISQRAALTKQLRDRFNEVEAKFEALDNLILGFNGTPAGRNLIAAYQASRIVRDLGAGHKTEVPNSSTP